MPTFAVVRGGQFVETRQYPSLPPPAQIKHENGVPQLRPYAEVKPSYNPATEALDGPQYTIADDLVTATWTKRSQSNGELAAAKAAAVNSINGHLKPLMKILLNHENRIRANSAPPQPALSMDDFKTVFEGLL